MKLAISGLLFFCALFAACSPTQIAGNGSEVTNGIVASATGPVDSAIVIAFPADYIPCVENLILPETTFTNKKGIFRMSLTDASWNLLVYDQTRQLGAFAERRKGESDMGAIKIDSLGAVACTVTTFSFDMLGTAYIGITGSPFYTRVIKDNSFFINHVPPYTYQITLWIYSHTTSALPVLLKDSVIAGTLVLPGMTSSIILNQ